MLVPLVFAAGSGPGSQEVFTIDIIDDNICEVRENILLQVSSPNGPFQCELEIIDNGELLYSYMMFSDWFPQRKASNVDF